MGSSEIVVWERQSVADFVVLSVGNKYQVIFSSDLCRFIIILCIIIACVCSTVFSLPRQ